MGEDAGGQYEDRECGRGRGVWNGERIRPGQWTPPPPYLQAGQHYTGFSDLRSLIGMVAILFISLWTLWTKALVVMIKKTVINNMQQALDNEYLLTFTQQ